MLRTTILACLLSGCASALPDAPIDASPYSTLREAYKVRDSALASSAYSSDAVLTYAYGDAPEIHTGRAEIDLSFQQFFAQFGDGVEIDLNFRVADSKRNGDTLQESGIYRLRHPLGAPSYGTFLVSRDMTQDGRGRFISDTSTGATAEDFETLPGPVLLDADDETLDLDFYGRFAGRYDLGGGCELVITQSIVRLFARNTCTQDWRGLTRASGYVWNAGDSILSDRTDTTYTFAAPALGESAVRSVKIASPKGTLTAGKLAPYRKQAVTFKSNDGTLLAGEIYMPSGASPTSGTVIVHGSGPQDRNGYASIIAVLADAFAAEGHAVLVYDKRGSGASSGDGSTASFAVLAEDAEAAMDTLEKKAGLTPDRIGLAGSSQAGWVVGKAIEQGARPSQTFLLGAAGSALSVPEQNLYNTETLMRCQGISEAEIALALDQQRAFFTYVETRTEGGTLDAITQSARQRPALADWLFPTSGEIDFSAGNWFTTLELDFDPLPVWADYPGRATFVFSEFDDSTPSLLAAERLTNLTTPAGAVHVRHLPQAQHLGLIAPGNCEADLGNRSRFSPALFDFIREAAGAEGDHPRK